MRSPRNLMVLLWALAMLAGCPDKKPKYPNCSGDKDCKAGQKCVNKKCAQCAADADCGPGKKCVAGGCEAIEGWCSGDGDCDNGQVCKDNKCVACGADAECGEGGKCKSGKCLRKGQCDSDEDCPEDQDCVKGVCVSEASGGTGGTLPACTLDAVYFGFDQYTLSDEAKQAMEKNLSCLNSAANQVRVVGRTDPRGTDEYNIGLSDNRAQAVVTYLTRLGIEPSRLEKVPKGALDATGTDEAGWAKDRRVEFEWR